MLSSLGSCYLFLLVYNLLNSLNHPIKYFHFFSFSSSSVGKGGVGGGGLGIWNFSFFDSFDFKLRVLSSWV